MNGDPLDELDEQGAEITRLRADVERLRLTDEEREAIRSACGSVKMVAIEKCFNTLLGLLERLA